MNDTISIFGLGKLGASMAASIASRRLNVIGVDIDERAVNLLNQGKAPVQETGLDETIAANQARIAATISAHEAVAGSSISFVIVPTPSDPRGAFELKFVQAALRDIGHALREKNAWHLVVVTSTVLPGSVRYGLLPVLEKESGKKCGRDFGLCYSPEFIALGSVIHDFLNPDFFLVGEFDTLSGDTLEQFYRKLGCLSIPCRRMSIENAELSKIALNSFVTMKISFANTLADMCERIPGGNVDVVSDALGMDKRIGRKYLTGGAGFGGPCFPRDNKAFSFIGRYLGANCDLPEINDRYNRDVSARMVEHIASGIAPGTKVAVLGLAYKPMTHVTEESAGLTIAKGLADAGMQVSVYDPLAGPYAGTCLPGNVLIAGSLEQCLETTQVVLVTTPDPAFEALGAADILGNKENVVVMDFWRILSDKLEGREGISYCPVGKCMRDAFYKEKLESLWQGQEDRDEVT